MHPHKGAGPKGGGGLPGLVGPEATGVGGPTDGPSRSTRARGLAGLAELLWALSTYSRVYVCVCACACARARVIVRVRVHVLVGGRGGAQAAAGSALLLR